MATIIDLESLIGKDIFTNKGFYCGKIKDVELDLPRFRVRAIVADAAKGSYLAEKVGGRKNVVIPYSMVNSIADVVIIKHFSAVEGEEKKERYYQKERVEEEG